MELYLVRHGETEWSRNGQHTSVTDLDLTETGREQALSLKEPLQKVEFDAVFTSPLGRARQTAELMGFPDAKVTDALHEWRYGDYEGRTSDDIREEHPDWLIWNSPVPGGESGEEVLARLQSFVDEVRAAHYERVLAFAHGHSLRVLTLAWLGLPIEFGRLFELGTATLNVLGEDDNNGPKIIRWNCVPEA